jgi:peptidyl-prolyl cis-trans isomerase A (cyclophilin A)
MSLSVIQSCLSAFIVKVKKDNEKNEIDETNEKMRIFVCFAYFVFFVFFLLQSPALLNPDAPEMNRRAPDRFDVRLETSKGKIVIEIHRDWAPRGVDRFYNLVRAGYYDQVRFHRVIKGRWAQFGINGNPKVASAWRAKAIPDDPRRESNVRGTIAYAFAVPNGRTTQVFFNLQDNSPTHDAEPFVPFGRVSEGLDVMDALNAEYGETSGGGIRAGKQGPLFEGGNAYLERNFPRLDYIIRATIVER